MPLDQSQCVVGNKCCIETYYFQLALGDSADTVGSEVGVSCLYAAQAAQVLIALLLPLGDEVLVCIAFLYTVLIQLWEHTQTAKSGLE